jgi:hypothetical protein
LGHLPHPESFLKTEFELEEKVELLDVSISQCYDLKKSGSDYLNDLAMAFTMVAKGLAGLAFSINLKKKGIFQIVQVCKQNINPVQVKMRY